MMMFARHDVPKLFGAAIAVAALGLVTPGSAVADATDDAFFEKAVRRRDRFFTTGTGYSEGQDGLRGVCLRQVAGDRARDDT